MSNLALSVCMILGVSLWQILSTTSPDSNEFPVLISKKLSHCPLSFLMFNVSNLRVNFSSEFVSTTQIQGWEVFPENPISAEGLVKSPPHSSKIRIKQNI